MSFVGVRGPLLEGRSFNTRHFTKLFSVSSGKKVPRGLFLHPQRLSSPAPAAGARVALASRVTDAAGDRWSDGMDSPRSELGIIVPAGLMWCGVVWCQHKPEGVLR